jgi:stage V sporulation protein B
VDVPLRNSAVSLILHLILLTPLLLFTDLRLYAMVIATMSYNLMMCIFNNLGVKKYLGYWQEIKKTFLIPGISALIMGILGYVFYQGIIMLCGSLLMRYLPARLVVLACMFVTILFCVTVYFTAELKLGGVTEEDLAGFPKGGSLIRLARRFELI